MVAGLTAVAGPAPAEVAMTSPQPGPLVKLRQATDSVELVRWGKRVPLDLGTYLVAGEIPFEVHTTRPPVAPYRHLVSARILRPEIFGGDITVPDGTVQNFRGLPDFTHVRIVGRDGKVAAKLTARSCSSAYEAVRVDPDAPDTSPYPGGCWGSHPFTLGAVQGIEAGWGVPAVDPWHARVKLAPGRYTARVSIDLAYRKLFGLSRRAAVQTVDVRVVRRGGGCGGGCELRDPVDPFDVGAPAEAADAPHQVVPTQPAAREPSAAVGNPPVSAMPDLRSLPSLGIRAFRGHFLAFGATVWNAGPSPLVVDGFRRPGADVMDAYQYFYDAAGTPYGHRAAGTMEWDERDGHHHWHFTDFARYRLLDADKQVVMRSKKEAFCLANTDAVDYTVPGANWRPRNTDLHTACGAEQALGVREVLDTGSGDTYSQYRPGQSFNLQGLASGRYFIEVTANPKGNLVESDTTNNTAYRKVRIGGPVDGKRTVKVFDVGLVHTR